MIQAMVEGISKNTLNLDRILLIVAKNVSSDLRKPTNSTAKPKTHGLLR